MRLTLNIKKTLVITIIVLIILYIIYVISSLQIILLRKGYKPTNYEVYKTFNYSSFELNGKDGYRTIKILKVYSKDGNFNYIQVARHSLGYWTFMAEGIPSNENRRYATFNWSEWKLAKDGEDFDVFSDMHKIFEIQRTDTKIQISFDNLPKDIAHIFSENDDFYTIEIFNKTAKTFADTVKVEISTLTNLNHHEN